MDELAAGKAASPGGADDQAIEAALREAHIPSLLMSLIHLTGDAGLLETVPRPDFSMIGDPQGGIPADKQEEVRRRAHAALRSLRPDAAPPPLPDVATIRRMMNFVAGTDIPERYVPFLLEELDLGGEAHRAAPPALRAPPGRKQGFLTLIIGAGMSGILTAIHLKQAGMPFLLVDKNDDFGGTWYENTYPGCRVDNPNYLYCYSFEPKHDWPQFFSQRPVLHAYFRRCVEKYGLRQHARLSTAVEEARWDEAAARWKVRLRNPDGSHETVEAGAVVSAVGQLNRPRYPEIEGLGSFEGPAFHSAEWDHAVDLTGKRVAVIGTGASAFQFVPEIAGRAAAVTVYQRTPPWLAPTPDYHLDVPPGKKWLLQHVPYYEAWYRFWLFWVLTDGIYPAVQVDPAWQGRRDAVSAASDQLRAVLTQYIESQTGGDAALARKLTPDYPPGGKRMLRDNGVWIAALRRPNVELVTDRISRITPRGLRLEDGREVEYDVLIYGTGFQASNFLSFYKVKGRGGIDLHEHWNEDARAYLGITVPGFPNFFCIYGPNTNIVVNGSIIFFSECAVRYILGCLKLLLEGGHDAIECRPEVHDAFNARIDAANSQMAWGVPQVTSWYKNKKGRVSQNWPLPLVDYWEATRAPDPADFILSDAKVPA